MFELNEEQIKLVSGAGEEGSSGGGIGTDEEGRPGGGGGSSEEGRYR